MRASISRIKLFKSCRKAYYFRYIEELEPVQKAEALETGSTYHGMLESLYNNGNLGTTSEDYSKERAMAVAYQKYIYPEFKVRTAEEWQNKNVGKHCMIGIVDCIAEDGNIVEHKTYYGDINESYEYNLQWDEQILAYMYMTGARKVYYTVCRKPTIRQKGSESDKEFFERMVEWYDTDTETKIKLMVIERTDEEVEQFAKDFEQICDDMEEAEQKNDFYRCTNYCNMWGRRCEYSSICLNYNPNQEYIEFKKRERS